MCSTSADWFSCAMARSTGMTCMPMPAPPGGTILVTLVRGKYAIRSKKDESSGCSSSCFWFIRVNSAEPGTNIGRTYCFSCAAFSQLYSMMPLTAISSRSSWTRASGRPEALTSSGSVMGTRTFMFAVSAASSSVMTEARPQ